MNDWAGRALLGGRSCRAGWGAAVRVGVGSSGCRGSLVGWGAGWIIVSS